MVITLLRESKILQTLLLIAAVFLASVSFALLPASEIRSQMVSLPPGANTTTVFHRLIDPRTSLGVHPFVVDVRQTEAPAEIRSDNPSVQRLKELLWENTCVQEEDNVWISSSWYIIDVLPPFNIRSAVRAALYYTRRCKVVYSAVVPELTEFTGFHLEMVNEVREEEGTTEVSVKETMVAHGPRGLTAYSLQEGLRAHRETLERHYGGVRENVQS